MKPFALGLRLGLCLGLWFCATGAHAESLVSRPAGKPPGIAAARQLIVVSSADWNASQGVLRRFERASRNEPFHAVGQPLTAFLGRAGLAWRSDDGAPVPFARGPMKREGDGKSPAGFLAFGEAWGYGAKAPAGLRFTYHQADESARCVDDAQSKSYGRIAFAPPAPQKAPWQSAELLRMPTDHYKYLLVIDYNMQAPRAGAGSCIFLHVAPRPGAATAGCTALYEEDLLTVLRFLDPQKQPLLLQLPQDVLLQALQEKELAAVLPAALVR